jgi:hypothetical protein
MQGFKDAQEIAEYRAKLAALEEQMKALLESGVAATQRDDEFRKEHKLEPGTGKKKLQGSNVSPAVRVIMGRLIEEYEMMEERLQNYEKSNSGKSESIGARALGNRYRI